jgi:hypothetical protein
MLVVYQYFLSPDAAVKPSFKTVLINGSVAVLAAVALVEALDKARHFRENGEAGAKVWFYDQSAQRLYPAPRDLISPDGNDDTRVRAVVIGFQGIGNKIGQLKIAYLEKYNPDLKALLERSVAAHAAKKPFTEKIPSPNSAYFQENFLVKRPGEPSWQTTGTEEARRLITEWREWRGPDGQSPIISVPSMQ